jgi:hypothetical protein
MLLHLGIEYAIFPSWGCQEGIILNYGTNYMLQVSLVKQESHIVEVSLPVQCYQYIF